MHWVSKLYFFGDCSGYHCCFHCLLRGLWNMTGQPQTPRRIVVFVFLWRWDGSGLWDAEWSETTWWSAMFLPEARREDNDQEIWAYRYVCEYTTHTHTHICKHIHTYKYTHKYIQVLKIWKVKLGLKKHLICFSVNTVLIAFHLNKYRCITWFLMVDY